MRVRLQRATAEDAADLSRMREAVSQRLRQDFGDGFWVGKPTERAALCDIRNWNVYIARYRGRLIASLALQGKKPWAIDRSYLTPGRKPLFLTRMAVDPQYQRQGIGRQCLDEARRIAEEQKADSICLDAFDCPAGAGPFYAKCGFRELGRAPYRTIPHIYYEAIL
ncbi:MAG TPA: GNAT family N-acetyltransferase [Terracidiphilus sp.]|nr:GNAT family N-acetyltransferase [Terracidiphilus sp.]